ncbi:MAG: bifunctional UDP-N-acetylmuramoyl-tripeptide:D-alanyl-D-alanine ligase/alanine racemase [Bacteroidota bacterium]|nr:bifunctional UDP-N-acetylmuramoyl-tripeptide:D-alanyl-D-alanine ligase/alanine racemase [Bacteroidota bacterium]
MNYNLKDIAEATNGILEGENKHGEILLLTDSRNLTNAEKTLFIALESKFNNGHQYVQELYSKGVRQFIVHQTFVYQSYSDASFIIVKNTLEALQMLAAYHRQKFNIPIIGITGSNGKTIVKEWLNQLLAPFMSVCINPKSYNSQIGVPLSVWGLNENHQLGIFEAGISLPHEMEKLEAIIAPSIGVFTYFGTAHNEGFENEDVKLREKNQLFKNCKVVLMHYNLKHQEIIKNAKTYDFENINADLNIVYKQIDTHYTHLIALYQNNKFEITIPFTDDVSIENACLCWLTCLHLNQFHASAFNQLSPISMRLELKKGINNCLLVNDSYSNDLHALSAGLSFLKRQNFHSKNTVILSDIEQSGLNPLELTREVANLLKEKNIHRFIGIGKAMKANQNVFENIDIIREFHETTLEFLQKFNSDSFANEGILIKGARKFSFEKIVKKLELQSHGCLLEINLTAALKNLETVKNHLPKGMKVMAMVKAFAYGSGTYEMAKLLQNKVDYLAVAYTDEGVALREKGITTPIMVLNMDQENDDKIEPYQLEPVIFSLNQLHQFAKTYQNIPLKIHIEIDTGMHRLGFLKTDITTLILQLQKLPKWQVASIFSHLSASDEPEHDDFTKKQFSEFKEMANEIETSLGYTCIKHISNTSAILRFQQLDFEMVRLGIGLYGIDPTGLFKNKLEPVFSFKTSISQIKVIQANESIGYSRQSITNKERKIAVLAVGYADGLNRKLSNEVGAFTINGQKAPILGNICMDMCMVDVSNIQCVEGDEAVLFGKQTSIESIADQINTIPYEILTSISQRVKRIYISE